MHKQLTFLSCSLFAEVWKEWQIGEQLLAVNVELGPENKTKNLCRISAKLDKVGLIDNSCPLDKAINSIVMNAI